MISIEKTFLDPESYFKISGDTIYGVLRKEVHLKIIF